MLESHLAQLVAFLVTFGRIAELSVRPTFDKKGTNLGISPRKTNASATGELFHQVLLLHAFP